MRRFIEVILVSCLTASLGLNALFVATFLRAYLHPTGQTIVDVNHFGEASWELPLFSVILVGSVVAVIRLLRKAKTQRYIL